MDMHRVVLHPMDVRRMDVRYVVLRRTTWCPAPRWVGMTASLTVGMAGVLKSPAGGLPAGRCAQAVAVVLSLS
jgi:hypothetical protein